MANVIITGLPRAGSALASALLDSLPNTVSFNQPPAPMAVAQKPLETLPYCKWLVGDYVWTRRALLDQEPVCDFRAADGTPLLDGLFDARRKLKEPVQEGTADTPPEPEPVFFTKNGLDKDFILAMRHHTLFTSVLPTLVQFNHFKIIAVIRNPLDVFSSWGRLPQPLISRGNPHGIARFWPELLAIMESNLSQAECFVQLYEAYLGRYHELRDHIIIVKYEDLLEDPALLHKEFGAKDISSAILKLIEKRTHAHNTPQAASFRDAFRKYGVFTKLYYPNF